VEGLTDQPGVIAGVVRDESGAPIEGAPVYFIDTPAPVPDVAALTGADGGFALTVPVGGTYTLESRAEGFAPTRATIDSRDAGGIELTLQRG
jgi:hypothetical protein